MHAHAYTCVCMYAHEKEKERESDWLGMERWTGRGGTKRINTHMHVHAADRRAERRMMGRGRKIQERDLLLGIYCYYPEGESYSTAGNAYVGCIYPIRAVYARASRMYVCVSERAAQHTRMCVATRHDCAHPVS